MTRRYVATENHSMCNSFRFPPANIEWSFVAFFWGGGAFCCVLCVFLPDQTHLRSNFPRSSPPRSLALSPLTPERAFSRLSTLPFTPLFPSPRTVFWSASRLKPRVEGGRDQENGGGISLTLSSLPLCVPLLFRFLSLSLTHTLFLSSGYFPPFSKRQRKQKKASQPPRKKTACRAESQRESWFMGWMDGSSSAVLPSPPKTLALLIHLYRVSSSPTPIDLSPQQPRKKFRILLLDAAARSIHPLLL